MVRHKRNKTCADCGYYECIVREDSFGPVQDEYCHKDHYDCVRYYSEACKDYMPVKPINVMED